LRQFLGVEVNTPEIIEIAYDLQAGSYIENALNDPSGFRRYCDELASVLKDACREISGYRTILDIGTGEMTVLSAVAARAFSEHHVLFACDISFSRLVKGREFVRKHVKCATIRPLVADFLELPFLDKSLDILMSTHALEPNGGKEIAALTEIFRVAKQLVILFEPSYENNSPDGQRRMDALGYVKGLPQAIEKARGKIVFSRQIMNNGFLNSPLNPTWAYVCVPSSVSAEDPIGDRHPLACPATKLKLEEKSGFLHCSESGLIYPIISGIPILRTRNAILATAFE
jgi:SAM-dependent methyltransferase